MGIGYVIGGKEGIEKYNIIGGGFKVGGLCEYGALGGLEDEE
ncbi:hypothetical protein [Staphylococcus saprophyticus]|nr:hypothetical protein [Staphylococcus saprophyticus]